MGGTPKVKEIATDPAPQLNDASVQQTKKYQASVLSGLFKDTKLKGGNSGDSKSLLGSYFT